MKNLKQFQEGINLSASREKILTMKAKKWFKEIDKIAKAYARLEDVVNAGSTALKAYGMHDFIKRINNAGDEIQGVAQVVDDARDGHFA